MIATSHFFLAQHFRAHSAILDSTASLLKLPASRPPFKVTWWYTSLWLQVGVVGALGVPVLVNDPISMRGCVGGCVVEWVVGWLVGTSVDVNGESDTPGSKHMFL